VATPAAAPAYSDRFVRSIREECLDRVILFGERRLRHVVNEFVAHDHSLFAPLDTAEIWST
jgi:putative transposase